MAYDLVVRGARIRGREGEGTLDLAVSAGKIAAVGRNLDKGGVEIHALGGLVAPTFIDPHVHLDKALISETVRDNVSGTLTEAIEIIWERKRNYTIEEIRSEFAFVGGELEELRPVLRVNGVVTDTANARVMERNASPTVIPPLPSSPVGDT